jgi:abequosyltransferase
MQHEPLLTIAVPTYNRAIYLDQLLAVLMEQINGDARVELLVSDNASQDDTYALVMRYKDRGFAFRYIRNETNIGADRNILQCHEQAAGEYVWIFSDDDLIAPGALTRIVEALSTGRYDLVSIGAYFFEGDYAEHKQFIPTLDIDTESAAKLARTIHIFLTFISGIIVNKKRISSVPHRPFSTLLDTNLGHLGPFYTALNHHRRSLVIRDPLIAARGNSNVGYALYHVFGTTLASITREWIDDLSVQRAIVNGTIQKFLPFWILMTRESRASRVAENPHRVLRKCYGNNFRYWMFVYPVYILPVPLARIWLFATRVINKVDSLLGNPLLAF